MTVTTCCHAGDKEEDSKNQTAKKLKTDVKDTVGREGVSNALTVAGKALATSEGAKGADSQPSTSAAADEAERTRDRSPADEAVPAEGNVYLCQYCDREFPTSKLLIAHELQHLIGNHFEVRGYCFIFKLLGICFSLLFNSIITMKCNRVTKDGYI